MNSYKREHWVVQNFYESRGWVTIKDSVNEKRMVKLHDSFKSDGYVTRLIKRIDHINVSEELISEQV